MVSARATFLAESSRGRRRKNGEGEKRKGEKSAVSLLSGISSPKGTNALVRAPPSWLRPTERLEPLTLVTSRRPPSECRHMGGGASTCGVGGTHAFLRLALETQMVLPLPSWRWGSRQGVVHT